MMCRFFFFFLLCFTATYGNITINNRILARVNGTPITAVDVVKHLDLIFYQQYPQYINSKEARLQFYTLSWEKILNDLIEKKLLLAEAETKKITLKNNEIRTEFQRIFGPRIIENLQKIGMTYDQAWEEIKEDLTIKKLINGTVRAKAVGEITPKVLQKAYEDFVAEKKEPPKYLYRVLTIRSQDPNTAAEIAHYGNSLLKEGHPFDETLLKVLKEHVLWNDQIQISLSSPFEHQKETMSQLHKNHVISLKEGESSLPVMAMGRNDQMPAYRIFSLEKITHYTPPPFDIIEPQLKGQLTEVSTNRYLDEMMQRLHKRNSVENFSLKNNDIPLFLAN